MDSENQSRFPYSHVRHRLIDFDYASAEHAYFVTTCARRGTTPFADDRLATEVITTLQWLRANQGLIIFAYCLMPDHLHLLLQLTDHTRTLGDLMASLKQFTTRQSWKIGYSGVLWQERFYDYIVRRAEDGQTIAGYILANPVRKGLVEEAAKWRWSGCPDPI